VKTLSTTAVILLCLASTGIPSDRAQNGKPGHPQTALVKNAARLAFDDLLDKAVRAKTSFGFASDDSLDEAMLGEPIPIYTISAEDACEYCDGDAIDSILTESGQWLVPVTVEGALRAFIEVSKTSSNTFVAVRGSTTTARVWKTIIQRWPKEKNFHPKLVVYGNIPGYFFTVPELSPPNMTDTVKVLAEVDRPAELSPATVILHSWNSDKSRLVPPDLPSSSAIANGRPTP
jgi:hypothetical protein